MQLVSQEISTLCSTMPIIDCKERASRPVINLFEFRFDYIEDNRNTVFIVVSYHSLMSVGSISHNYAVFLWGKLCRVVILSELHNLFLLHFTVFLSLSHSHFHSTIHYNTILVLWINFNSIVLSFLSLCRKLAQRIFYRIDCLCYDVRFFFNFS